MDLIALGSCFSTISKRFDKTFSPYVSFFFYSRMKNKIVFFIKRYGLAELVSATISYLLAYLAYIVTSDKILISYLGSIGAFIGFYLIIFIRDFNTFPQSEKLSKTLIYKRIIVNLVIEFGLSELLDVFIIRPLCIYLAQLYLTNFTITIITGNIAANVIFFLLSAIMFNYKDSVTQFFSKKITGS